MNIGVNVDIGDASDDSFEKNEETGDREVRNEDEHRVHHEADSHQDLEYVMISQKTRFYKLQPWEN